MHACPGYVRTGVGTSDLASVGGLGPSVWSLGNRSGSTAQVELKRERGRVTINLGRLGLGLEISFHPGGPTNPRIPDSTSRTPHFRDPRSAIRAQGSAARPGGTERRVPM